MKKCTRCKMNKPNNCFDKCSKVLSGLSSNCKACKSLYRKENREKLRLGNAKWRNKTPELQKKAYARALEQGRYRAICAVQRAVKNRVLVNLKKTEIHCVDCWARATMYDHRDYNRPLLVDAVCRACNFKRGPAIVLRKPIGYIKRQRLFNKLGEKE